MKINGIHNGFIVDANASCPSKKSKAQEPLPLDDNEKIALLTRKFEDILQILGLNLEDESLRNTPHRIAKMYINEIFKGINPRHRPQLTLFENSFGYHSPLIELNIPFTSFCEHHFVPITGRANLAYIPKEKIIGLSKLHRLVNYYARRPQVQERLTLQLLQELKTSLQTEDVGVVLKASHSCISCRGVEHQGSSTITSLFSGKLAQDEEIKAILYGSGSSQEGKL